MFSSRVSRCKNAFTGLEVIRGNLPGETFGILNVNIVILKNIIQFKI